MVGAEKTKSFFARAPPKKHVDKASKKVLLNVFKSKLHIVKGAQILGTLQDNTRGKYIEKARFDAWLSQAVENFNFRALAAPGHVLEENQASCHAQAAGFATGETSGND